MLSLINNVSAFETDEVQGAFLSGQAVIGGGGLDGLDDGLDGLGGGLDGLGGGLGGLGGGLDGLGGGLDGLGAPSATDDSLPSVVSSAPELDADPPVTPSGYELVAATVTAADGNTAITRCEEHKPDVVVLDMMLPGRSGFLALEKIKEAKPSSVVSARLHSSFSTVKSSSYGSSPFLITLRVTFMGAISSAT